MKRLHKLAIGGAGLVAASTSAVLLLPMLGTAAPASATVALPKVRTTSLVEATSGPAANEMQATGEQAKLINAALPFTRAGVRAAQPFEASGSSVDQQRALLCLTQAVYYEAGFEPLEGRRAVAQVVLNRLRHPAFPKSICGVVYQGSGTRVCQFTFVCDGALYRRPAADAWRAAEAVARAALDGYVERSVGEATHYHADYVAPRWAPMLAKVAQIGQHIFYRWPGAWGQPQAFAGRYIGEPRDPLSMRPSEPSAGPAGAKVIYAKDAYSGPPVPRAANDVGGLLDTSKGWTLHIPGPDETESATATAVASQQLKPIPVTYLVTSGGGAATGSR